MFYLIKIMESNIVQIDSTNEIRVIWPRVNGWESRICIYERTKWTDWLNELRRKANAWRSSAGDD